MTERIQRRAELSVHWLRERGALVMVASARCLLWRPRCARALGGIRPPSGRVLAAGLVVALSFLATGSSDGMVGIVRADEPADAPLPEITPQALAGRLRAAWAGYDRGLLEITFEVTANTNWRFQVNRGTPAEQEPMIVQFPGRARFFGEGRRWRVEYDSMIPRALSKTTNPHRWSSGHDGTQLYGWDVMRNTFTYGETEIGAEIWRPTQQFWYSGASLAELLAEPIGPDSTLSIGQRTVAGVRCYVVERTHSKSGTRAEEVISPRQGYLILSSTWSREGNPYHIKTLHGVHQAAPGVWAPGRMVEENRSVRNDGQEQLLRRTESRVVRFEPNRTFNPDTFDFEPPYGADVTDLRLGYSYHNDPWWPEAGGLLRAGFDWPQADMSTLRDLGTPAKFEGKAAPPIAASGWINSEPLELAKLRGKVVLVEFWGTTLPPSNEKIPALRTVYETYHKLGLEMISIHTPTKDVAEIERFAREFLIPYPIAIDAAGKTAGVTSLAYGVEGYPCVFLIDDEGEVHSVSQAMPNGSQLDQEIVKLLENAGAKGVPALTRERARLSADMIQAITKALPTWIEAAPATDMIRGRVLDGRGQPIAGARVSARLTLTLLISATPGGYQSIPLPARFEAITGSDGRFVLFGLTKGMYTLKFEAPELAWRERVVPIGPNARSAEVEIALDQGDAITGFVRDTNGEPIAGAIVNPTKWHHRTPNGGEVFTTPSGAKLVQTDATGRYLLKPLQHGRYTLEVSGRGFQTSTLETVTAGTPNADVKLERSKP